MSGAERKPPQNIEAEKAVLGAMLIKREAITEAQEMLRAEDFYREAHRIVYGAIETLFTQNEAVDLVTLTEELRKEQVLDKVGGISFVTDLANTVPTAANLAYHAKIVREKAELRRLIDAATEIAGKAYEDAEEVADIMDDAEKKILAVAANQKGGAFEPISNILMDTISRVESLFESQGGLTGIATGFKDLDELTSGLQKSDLVLVAARPSMGKTAFTLNIAAYAALHESSVAFFSLEMSKEQLVQRMLCSEGGIDSQRLRTGKLEDEEWERLIHTADKLSKAKIYIDDTPGMSVPMMRTRARRLARKHSGIALIVIDYLQLMTSPGGRKNDNRVQELSEITRGLKMLAKELDVPVIALSQLSRTVESRDDKHPMLSDLRDSGSIEQDADIVMFLYRDDYYNKDTEFQLLGFYT